MSAKSFRKMVVLAVALIVVSAGYARADKLGLQEKLGKDINIKLKDVTIAEALEKIGKKAVVNFVLSDEAIWKLPQGGATRLSVVLNGPLAESMAEMLNAFFMRYAVGEDEITIYPRPELEHILGRPTAKQLELLKDIYTRPIQVYFLDEVQKSINAALGQEVLVSPVEVQEQLNKLLRKLVGEKTVQIRDERGRAFTISKMPGEDLAEPPKEYNLPSSVTLVQLLRDVKLDRYTARWYIPRVDFPGQIPEVRVVSSGDFRSLQREQKIDISYKDEKVHRILRDLADRGKLELYINPNIQLDDNTISVSMQNVTIGQAMRNIADMVGAWYEFEGYRMEIKGFRKPDSRKPASAARPKPQTSSGYVGKISIPMDGGKYFIEFMLRENDLTEELKKLREEKMKEILGEKESKPKVKKKSSD